MHNRKLRFVLNPQLRPNMDHEHSTVTASPVPQPKLLILRGSPGSGKTTLATSKFDGWKICSADDFFTDKNGKYKFDGRQLQLAHDSCYQRTVAALEQGVNVVVDNTNKSIWEFKRYLSIPNVEIKVYRVASQFKSTKNIPDHIIQKYTAEYQPFEGGYYNGVFIGRECQVMYNKRTNEILFKKL